MLKLVDVGGVNILEVMFASTAKPTACTIQLFTDSSALADSDIHSTHTLAAGGGYVDKTLSNNATVAVNAGIPEAVWPAQTWTFTGPLTGNATVKGYQVVNGTTLLFAELIADFTPTNNNDKIILTPKFRLGNGTPA